MSPVRRIAIALAAGGFAGLVVLGLGGRLAMAALVVARDARPAVTLGGSLEVLAVGTGYGAVGGLLALGARRMLGPRTGRWQGVGLGLAGLAAQRTLAVGLAVLCFGGFGLLLDALLARWLRPDDVQHEAAA